MDLSNYPTLQEAAELIRNGRREPAKKLLATLIKHSPQNEAAWVLLSYALEDRKQKVFAFKRILQINPGNSHVRSRLKTLVGESAPAPASTPAAISTTPATRPELRAQAPAPKPHPTPPASAAATSSTRSSLLGSVAPEIRHTTRPAEKVSATPAQPSPKYSRFHRLQTRWIIAWRRARLNWRFFSQSKLALLGLLLILLFGLMAVAFPILINSVWPRGIYDPVTGFDVNVFPHPSPPGPGHILGTDSLGRDVLSMILAATTPTFTVGLTAAFTTAAIGTLLSVIAAYFRGGIDLFITNLADVFLLFPAPVIMVIIGARFRDLTPVQLGLIYGFVTGMGGTTIVMRAQAIQMASKPFMEAAHIAGGSAWHIISKHLIPSVLPLAALQMMLAVTGAVVADGFISFFGITRTSSNWGTIIYDAFVYGSISGAYGPPWHMLIPAAACFTLFALGFYLVSRGLHRVASPIIRERY